LAYLRCTPGAVQEEAEQEGREPQAQAVLVKVRGADFSIRRPKKALLKESLGRHLHGQSQGCALYSIVLTLHPV